MSQPNPRIRDDHLLVSPALRYVRERSAAALLRTVAQLGHSDDGLYTEHWNDPDHADYWDRINLAIHGAQDQPPIASRVTGYSLSDVTPTVPYVLYYALGVDDVPLLSGAQVTASSITIESRGERYEHIVMLQTCIAEALRQGGQLASIFSVVDLDAGTGAFGQRTVPTGTGARASRTVQTASSSLLRRIMDVSISSR